MPHRKLVLICTGLGRVQRGFEMYISSLAQKLATSNELQGDIEVWCGGNPGLRGVQTKRILNIYRNGFFGKRLGASAFLWEQRSFFLGMLPYLIKYKQAVFYLGEYRLYCYLYKFRKLFGLNYSLVLYTGGQAIPGLFDPGLDFVHHVTDVYVSECRHIPSGRQLLLPHFIPEDFEYNNRKQYDILQKAGGRKIILSVGLLDKATKRMDWLVESLAASANNVFPVLLGECSSDTESLKEMLEKSFGKDGFIMQKVSHKDLGNWYSVADLFALCSPRESFGLAMVEALYHGLPVICCDFPEARFVLGSYGQYVQNQVTKDLGRVVKESLQKEKESKERIAFARQTYSWTVLESPYEMMFRRMIENIELTTKTAIA